MAFSAAQQVADCLAVLRISGDADADAARQMLTPDIDWLPDFQDDVICDLPGQVFPKDS